MPPPVPLRWWWAWVIPEHSLDRHRQGMALTQARCSGHRPFSRLGWRVWLVGLRSARAALRAPEHCSHRVVLRGRNRTSRLSR